VEWGDGHFGPHRSTVCIIGPQNAASIRVAQKCGYAERLRTVYKGEPTVLFERSPTGVARFSSH
jgi:RimJ/RimL family protein N-acetyltransferase